MQDITKGDLIIYEDENDKIEIEAFLYNETIWLALNKIAELFEKDKSTISEHIKNIFDELLEIIKEIRTSERRFYQKVTDIFAECSIDYNKNSEIANNFYATIQNKFHYAITNETAAEIIYHRANSKKEHMGLTSWKHSPNGKVLKSDVSIAKNYLTNKELDFLQDKGRISTEQAKQFFLKVTFDKILKRCYYISTLNNVL